MPPPRPPGGNPCAVRRQRWGRAGCDDDTQRQRRGRRRPRPSTRTCARKTANGGALDKTGGMKDLSDGRSSRKSPKREIDGAGGEHLMDLKMGISPLPRAGGGIKLL